MTLPTPAVLCNPSSGFPVWQVPLMPSGLPLRRATLGLIGGGTINRATGVELPDGSWVLLWSESQAGVQYLVRGYAPDWASLAFANDGVDLDTAEVLVTGTQNRGVYSSITVGPDGAIWAWILNREDTPVYSPKFEAIDNGANPVAITISLYRSIDLGDTWAHVQTIPGSNNLPPPSNWIGWNGTSFGSVWAGGEIVQFPGSTRWYALGQGIRDFAQTYGPMLITSTDQGETWSVVVNTTHQQSADSTRNFAWSGTRLFFTMTNAHSTGNDYIYWIEEDPSTIGAEDIFQGARRMTVTTTGGLLLPGNPMPVEPGTPKTWSHDMNNGRSYVCQADLPVAPSAAGIWPGTDIYGAQGGMECRFLCQGQESGGFIEWGLSNHYAWEREAWLVGAAGFSVSPPE